MKGPELIGCRLWAGSRESHFSSVSGLCKPTQKEELLQILKAGILFHYMSGCVSVSVKVSQRKKGAKRRKERGRKKKNGMEAFHNGTGSGKVHDFQRRKCLFNLYDVCVSVCVCVCECE